MLMLPFKKAGSALLIAALLSSLMAPGAMAASKKKIGKINLTIDTDIRIGKSGGEVQVTPTGDNTDSYYVDNCEIINDEGDDWSRSKPPEIEITLGVEDEDLYYFSSTSSSGYKLTLGSSCKYYFDDIKFEKAVPKENKTLLVLTAQLVFDKVADKSKAVTPSNPKWNTLEPGKASWGGNISAKYYQVQLIKGDAAEGSVQDIYDTFYSFAGQITSPGSYKFKVRSVKSSNDAKSNWAVSGAWNVTEADIIALGNTVTQSTPDTPASVEGWQKTADQNRWWWRNADGSYPASTWKQISGQWYYFDAEGYMATGWITLDGKSYYLDPGTGAMYANTRTPDNFWVNESGIWIPDL